MVEDPQYEREGRGREQKKKAAQAVEALAVRMVGSSEAICKSLPLSEELRHELDQARKITARTARKRQLKRLASLLRRDEDVVVAIQSAIDAEGRSSRTEREFFHHIEELRDGLCDPERFAQSLEDASADLPGFNRAKFTRLAKRVHKTGDKGASREIFRTLRALAETNSEG